jgi:hypothetical protein
MAAHASSRFLGSSLARLAANVIRWLLRDESVAAKTKKEKQRRYTQEHRDEESRA